MKSNKNIKICYVVSVDITLKFLLLPQLKFLQSQGYDVHAVCSPGKWVEDIKKEGIKVETIQIKRKIFSPVSDIIALTKLILFLKKEKFDVVHTHTPKAGFVGRIAAKLAGIPIIINTVHGFYFTEHTPFILKKFFIFLEKLAAKCSDIIFFVNKEDMQTAVAEKICPSEKERYFGGWIDLKKFNPSNFFEEFKIKLKKDLGLAEMDKVIGIVARLVEEKGYLELFSAFKKVLEIFPGAVLMIIGQREPQKKDAIDVEKSPNILYLGEKTDVEKFYSIMDVFVLPSHREGLGISLIEASAMERPVVATDIRGCREAVENGKTGILVPVKNPERLAEAIIYLLENSGVAAEMGRQGRQKVEKEFDERLVFDRIKKEYDRLIIEKGI